MFYALKAFIGAALQLFDVESCRYFMPAARRGLLYRFYNVFLAFRPYVGFRLQHAVPSVVGRTVKIQSFVAVFQRALDMRAFDYSHHAQLFVILVIQFQDHLCLLL